MPRRKSRRKRHLDLLRDTPIDDWVLGLILVGIPFSIGMWLVVSAARDWLMKFLPEDQNTYVSFLFGVGMIVLSIYIKKKLGVSKPSV